MTPTISSRPIDPVFAQRAQNVFPVPGIRIPCSAISYSLFYESKFPVLRFEIPCSCKPVVAGKCLNSALPGQNSRNRVLQKIRNSLLIADNREFLRKNRPPAAHPG
jgi:hypothetical protein